MILPIHPQSYPAHVLPHRLEEYCSALSPPTTDRRAAQTVTGAQVLDATLRAQRDLINLDVDPRYFVGTCFHEAGCTNEVDTEVATPSCVGGFRSGGAYQIGDDEAHAYHATFEDTLDLDKSTQLIVLMARDHRRALRLWAGFGDGSPDPDYVDAAGRRWQGGNMRAYLAIAHNHGLGFAHLTIRRYGMNWAAYKQRNPGDNLVAHGYGDDVITGGGYWPPGA